MNLRIPLLLLFVTATAGAQSISTGTGFFVDQTHVVTCAHCVADSARVLIIRSDSSKSDGTVMFADEELDVAVVTTDRPSSDTLGIGDSESVKILDDLFVFGFPLASKLGSELSAYQGKLNSRRSIGGKQWLQLDATINPGSSGGPILNAAGQVVGIAVARLDPLQMAKDIGTIPERINFAIPSSIVRLRLARSNVDTPLLQPAAPIADMAAHAAKATVLLMSIGKAPEGKTLAQEQNKLLPNQEVAADRFLRIAAAKYITSGNAATLEGEMEPYAEHVDYYDRGIKNRGEIWSDLAAQRKKWTERHYELSRVVRTEYDPAKDMGVAIVHYSYEVSSGSKRKSGEAESLLVFRSILNDPKVILVKEHKMK